jgi:hypothetical protein
MPSCKNEKRAILYVFERIALELGIIFIPNGMTNSVKPSVKVSVEPSVKGKAMGSFGNVKSSEKTLAFIG